MQCKICEAESRLFSVATLLNQYEVQYFQCEACSFVQTEEPYWLEEAYSEAIAISDVGIVSRNLMLSDISAQIILNFFDQEAQFIDYGGGYGLFVRMMRDLGFDFYWYDKFCQNIFAKNFEAKINSVGNADTHFSGKYELTTAFEVFEHLVNPIAEIEEILEHSDNILFSTELLPPGNPKPDEWWYYAPAEGQHISIYTSEALLKIAQRFDLNLYSNGYSVHLLTSKNLSLQQFQSICRYSNRSVGRRSLVQQDYRAAIGALEFCPGDAQKTIQVSPDCLTESRHQEAPKKVENSAASARIVIDGVFFQIVQTGIARVWRSLLEEWAVSGFAQHLLLLDRNGTAPKIPGIRAVTIPRYDANQVAADRQLLQRICDAEQANLFISTYYTTPLTTPAAFMAYDMIPEVQQADLTNPMWQAKHRSIRYADRFLAISENTARDLVKFFPEIALDRVQVAHCGVDPAFQPATPEEIQAFQTQYGITQPYFLLVGMRNQYKNSRLFFQAFARLANKANISIVCVGPTPVLEEEYRSYVVGSQVHILSLTDAELRFAYAGALAFVYPSRYEGFGLPLLEAMACGCPVITCSNSSIPEVAGNAALYVSEGDPAELTEAMMQIQQPELRDRLIQAGLDRTRLFSWERMATIVGQTLAEAANLPIGEPAQQSGGLPRLWVSVPRLLEQYHANPADLQVIDQLRQARQQWLRAWMAIAPQDLLSADAGELGQIRRSLLQSFFCQVALTETEAQDLQQLTELTADFDRPQALQALLAMLLYRPVYQLALPLDPLNMPANWREEYLTYLLRLPPYFQEKGEAEAYCCYLQGLTDYLHRHITQHPDNPEWQAIAQIFTDRANFLLTYFTPQNLKTLYRQRAEIMESALTQQGHELDYSFPARTETPAKLRIGILASHFSPQTETFATLPLFTGLNRDRFEIILFMLQPTGHRLERYSLGHTDYFVALPETLHEQVQMIRETDLDVLFIASNLTVAAREITLLALHRLARVQLTGMNSPVTTGMRHMDYYLTSRLTEPGQDLQAHYCEKLIALNGAAQCFEFATEAEPLLTATLTRSDLQLSEKAIVYSSGANFYKITPEIMDTWAQIIAEVQDSVLVLYPFNQNWSSSYPIHSFHDRLCSAFARYGMGSDRYRILPAAPNRSDVKARLKLTDIYLDSYPFSGMTSLIDPLELGIPAIVMEVDSACSLGRGGAFLRELQVADLIVFDQAGYVQKAIALGKDAGLRQQMGDRIQQAMDRVPSFLNVRSYSRQIGAVFTQLAQQHHLQAVQQAFRLRSFNLLALPDWNQPESDLFAALVNLVRFGLTHPDRQTMTILIAIGNWDEADADDAISSVLLYLISEEGIDAEDGAEIVLLQPQDLSSLLLSQIQNRIALDFEDTSAIATAQAASLPIITRL